VSTNDEAIDPNLQRLFAKRMGAQTIELVRPRADPARRFGAPGERARRA